MIGAAMGLLAACHLIDQRDFDPNADRPPHPIVARRVPAAPRPLITIRYDIPDPDYRDALAVAVDAARRRKPDVLFRVVTVVPARGTPVEQARAAALASRSGREVAEAIAADGADIGEIELAARVDPAAQVKEVRVYVQ